MTKELLRVMGDDLVLYFQISRVRDDFLGVKLSFALIGPAANDLLGQSRADAGKRIQLLFTRGVDVYQVLRGSRWRRCLSSGLLGRRRLSRDKHYC